MACTHSPVLDQFPNAVRSPRPATFSFGFLRASNMSTPGLMRASRVIYHFEWSLNLVVNSASYPSPPLLQCPQPHPPDYQRSPVKTPAMQSRLLDSRQHHPRSMGTVFPPTLRGHSCCVSMGRETNLTLTCVLCYLCRPLSNLRSVNFSRTRTSYHSSACSRKTIGTNRWSIIRFDIMVFPMRAQTV